MTKFQNIENRTQRFVYNDYTSDHVTLLNKSNKCTVEVRRLRVLALEAFRSVNKLNPVNPKRHKEHLKVPIRTSVAFEDKSVRVLGLQI